jgi:hypothetical protein
MLRDAMTDAHSTKVRQILFSLILKLVHAAVRVNSFMAHAISDAFGSIGNHELWKCSELEQEAFGSALTCWNRTGKKRLGCLIKEGMLID